MKIKDKTVLVYDIESFPNLFTCSILNSENNKLIIERNNFIFWKVIY